MEEIKEKIKNILTVTMGVADTEVTSDAHLSKDLGVDSLDFAELVMEFEQEFDIRIPFEEAEMLIYVKDVEEYVAKKLS
ncbi:MAG: acyl carrier protein [Bacteroidetes bacterium]|nr:acyl carrier protein [Bacteroidota bacterium]MCH8232725.1 acyl carrier protein [Bacteroidota bacterium]